jgi:uncharacterized protein (DUF1499 family)
MSHRRLFVAALTAALVAAFLLAIAGVGFRADWWGVKVAFGMERWAAYLAIVAVVLAAAGLVVARPVGRASVPFAVVLLVGVVVASVPWGWMQRARSLPAIHDITTDTQDPPQFVAVLPLRAHAANESRYGGERVAVQQRAAYPEVRPLVLPDPPAAAFARVAKAAAAMGWTLVQADPATGRLEATATTRWFHFKDDVVIRVRPEGTGSRVDMRSVSRIGASDIGTNAARIREFMRRLASTAS